jgi:hypothetical protein
VSIETYLGVFFFADSKKKPADWTLHSFPFAYMAIDVWSTDSQPHHVQIYSDVSGGKFPPFPSQKGSTIPRI